MNIPRSRRIPAACALLVIAGGVTALAVSGLDMHWIPGSKATPAAADSASATSQARADGPSERPSDKGITLRLDDTLSLAPPANTTARDRKNAAVGGVDAHDADDFIENEAARPQLNLRVPNNVSASAGQAETRKSDQRIRDGQPIEPRMTLETGTAAQPRPYVETFSLFNPDYGLRGFMKQGWINQRVAFQGGLGLDDDRIDQTRDDDFRDNIAVGMGLIVAF